MAFFELLNIDSIDWQQLDALPDRTIFQTLPWLKFIAHTQNAQPIVAVLRDGNCQLGYFTGLIVRKFGLKIMGSPFPGWTTYTMGFNLLPEVPKTLAMEALCRFVFEKLQCVHMEIMDRNLTGPDWDSLNYLHRAMPSFLLDMEKTDDELFAGLSKSCRRDIRKAERNGIMIEEAKDLEFADDYYAQLVEVFGKRSLVPTYPIDRVRALIKYVYPSGHLLLLRARNPEGVCIATGIFPALNHYMYFWGGASWKKYQFLLPNEAIQWYAMKYWKKRGIIKYDFLGGGNYKRKYGGNVINIPRISKSKYKFIGIGRDLSKKIVRLKQELAGTIKKSFK